MPQVLLQPLQGGGAQLKHPGQLHGQLLFPLRCGRVEQGSSRAAPLTPLSDWCAAGTSLWVRGCSSSGRRRSEGSLSRSDSLLRLFDAEKPWSKLVRGAYLVRPNPGDLTWTDPVISPRGKGAVGDDCSPCCKLP